MKTILVLVLCGSAFAEEKKLSDADRLRIREAQLQATAAYADALQAQLRYQQVSSQLAAALAEVAKAYGCEIDPQSVQCKPLQDTKQIAQ